MVRFQGADGRPRSSSAELPNVVFADRTGAGVPVRLGLGRPARRDRGAGERGGRGAAGRGGRRRACSTCPTDAARAVLLTPHAGELAKLLGQERSWVTADPIGAVRAGVDRTGATVLLKGASQLVAGPERGTVSRWRCQVRPGPAQAGSGDVARRGLRRAAGRRQVRPDAGQLGASLQAVAATAQPGVDPAAAARRGHGAGCWAGCNDGERAGRGPMEGLLTTRRRPGSTRRPHAPRSTWRRSGPTSPTLQARVGSTADAWSWSRPTATATGWSRALGEARAAGADWLGVATPAEALALREAGDEGRLLAWLYGAEEDLTPLVAADVDVSAQSLDQISRLRGGGRYRGTAGSGASQGRHRPVPQRRRRRGLAGAVRRRGRGRGCGRASEVVGIWSHLAAADEPGHPSVPIQLAAFERGVRGGAAPPDWNPPCGTSATRRARCCCPTHDSTWCGSGIAAYGIDPAPGIAALAGVPLRR